MWYFCIRLVWLLISFVIFMRSSINWERASGYAWGEYHVYVNRGRKASPLWLEDHSLGCDFTVWKLKNELNTSIHSCLKFLLLCVISSPCLSVISNCEIKYIFSSLSCFYLGIYTSDIKKVNKERILLKIISQLWSSHLVVTYICTIKCRVETEENEHYTLALFFRLTVMTHNYL